MSEDDGRLRGIKVLVTRPVRQAEGFCYAIEQVGGEAVGLPVIAIEPIVPLSFTADLTKVDACVFVSSNAVEFGVSYLNKLESVCVGVGSKTASCLRAAGVEHLLEPEHGFTSEDVLALPELQHVSEKSILIFRGEGGREMLAETFRLRGAKVEYIEVYRRVSAPCVEDDILRALTVNIVAITSVEGLANLQTMVGKARLSRLKKIPLLVGSERILAAATKYGFQGGLVLADDPTDNSMLTALMQWADTRGT